MNQEKSVGGSPFAALTYREQQDRWLAWRSKQLDYQPVKEADENGQAASHTTFYPKEYDRGQPRLRIPNMRIAAPTRHQELDQVLLRHRQALRQAGTFHTTSID